MKIRIFTFITGFVLSGLTSCASRPYVPSQVEASPPPYQSESEVEATRKLLHKNVEIQDWRETKTGGICPVHKLKMEVIVVPGMVGGCILWPDNFCRARERYFPNAGIWYNRAFYSDKLGKIYVCPKCLSASKLWGKEQE